MQSANHPNATDNMAFLDPNLIDDIDFGNFRKGNKARSKGFIDDVRENGVHTSIVVRPHPTTSGRFQLVAGYGRRDLCREFGYKVPATIKQIDDQEAFKIHLSENIQRENLDLVDEVRAVQYYLTIYNGDRHAAAFELKLDIKTLNERAELNKCSENVLDALRAKQIKPQHALILSSFSHALQDKTVVKIISEGWSVQLLKEKANLATLPLTKAKFDQRECQNCPKNTKSQHDLFNNVDSEARCSEPTCYHQKTKQWLESRKVLMEEAYGNVIYLSETNLKSCNTVSPDKVGDDQYKTGCLSCDSRVVILNDTRGHEGNTTDNQCVDKSCYTRCINAVSTATVSQGTIATKSSQNNEVASKANSASKANKKVTVAKPSAKATALNKSILRKAAAEHFDGDVHYQLATVYVALLRLFKHGVYTTELPSAYKLSQSELQAKINELVKYGIHTYEDAHVNSGATDMMIRMLVNSPDVSQALAVKHWLPTKENLEVYTCDVLIDIAEQAQISDSLPKDKSKSALIEYLVKTLEGKADFAPKQYLMNLK